MADYGFGGGFGDSMGGGTGLSGTSDSSGYGFGSSAGSPAAGMGLGSGLSGTSDSSGYGFSGGSYGLQGASNYGEAPGAQYSLDPSYYSPNYSLDSQFSLSQLGQANEGLQSAGYQGLQAGPTGSLYGGLAAPGPAVGLQGTQAEQGFWGSRPQKIMSFLAGFHPVTAGINAVAQAMNSPNPATAGLQAALGRLGPVGNLASMGIGAATSNDPAGYLGRAAGTTGAGMVGGMLGGPALGSALGGFTNAAIGSAQARGNYGAYGTGSALGGVGEGGGVGGPSATASGGGTDWGKTLMGVGSGLYGMYKANQQQQLAQQAIRGSAPWQTGGGAAGAGQQLSNVISGDFSKDAGFKAAQLAAARASSQQPGGMAATAAAQAALKYQNDRIQALGGAAGVGFNPAQGYQTALQGNAQANELAGQSLGSIGYGLTGSGAGTGAQQMPPWFQQYLINNKMGG